MGPVNVPMSKVTIAVELSASARVKGIPFLFVATIDWSLVDLSLEVVLLVAELMFATFAAALRVARFIRLTTNAMTIIPTAPALMRTVCADMASISPRSPLLAKTIPTP